MNVAKHASKGLGHAQDALRHQGQNGALDQDLERRDSAIVESRRDSSLA